MLSLAITIIVRKHEPHHLSVSNEKIKEHQYNKHMSNYPNMSYCMYENTVAALNQICNDLSDSLDDQVTIEEYREDLSSRQEAEAFDRIKYMCNCVLSLIENLSNVEEKDEEDDNEFIVTDDEMIPA